MAVLQGRSANPEGRMSLGEHFREFRNRLLIAVLAIAVGGLIGWMLYDPVTLFGHHFQGVWASLIQPLTEYRREHPHKSIDINFDQATQAFSMRMKVSLWVGLILSSPVWLWQIWGFLVPGLTPKEKRVARQFICAAVPLFLLGCALGGFAIQTVLTALYGITPDEASNIISVSNYVSFITNFILVFGLAFLMPVGLMGLNGLRILSGRMMLKGWRIAVMVIALFSAIMSPTPDAMSMLFLLIPMLILYFGSCGLALLLDKRRGERRRERSDWQDTPDDEASSL